MKTSKCVTSSCRYCSSYQHEGRRGGVCNQLGVIVHGQWKSCSLAKPIFNSTWKNIDRIALLEQSFSLQYEKDEPLAISN